MEGLIKAVKPIEPAGGTIPKIGTCRPVCAAGQKLRAGNGLAVQYPLRVDRILNEIR
jgi:hypothetical protein